MNMAVVVVTTAFTVTVVIVFMERHRQLVNPWKEEFMHDREDINVEFEEISKELYTNKSEDEFQLGLALASVLDALDNSDAYDEEALDFVFKNADEQTAYFRMKYGDDILALNEEADEH